MTPQIDTWQLAIAPWLTVAQTSLSPAIKISWRHTWPWPLWATLLALALAAAIVITLYLRENRQTRLWVRLALAAIRISLLGLLLIMMYGWMMHRQRTDQPDLVVAVDVSKSMGVRDEYADEKLQGRARRRVAAAGLSTANRLNLAKSLLLDDQRRRLKTLAGRYHLKPYYIGDAASRGIADPTGWGAELRQREATDDSSRLGVSLLQILQAQRGRPTAAIVVLTDGATTSGATVGEAAEFARQRNIPLYVVGIGNETPPRDALVADLLTDDIVFVNDVVNFDFTVQATGYADRRATVRLRRQGRDRVLAEQTITLKPDNRPQPVRLTDRPATEGMVDYIVELLPLEGETNVDNNHLARQIEVRDSTIRVLMVQAYPNYEFRALKNLLGRAVKSESNAEKAIELTTILQSADVEHAEQDATARSDFPVSREELFAQDVVIFGDVNPAFLGNAAMENLADFVTDRGGGVVFLGGSRFTPWAYRGTPLEPLFPFSIETAVAPDADVLLDEPFRIRPTPLGLETPHLQLGDTPAASEAIWNDLDAMYWLLETPDVKPAARVLAVHPTRVNNAARPLPAILMQLVGAGKVVAHNIDETYLWSRHQGRQRYYSRYWLQMLRYLSRGKLLSEDRAVRIVTQRGEYRTGEPVRISVELAPGADGFDAAPVTVMIEHENGARRELTLARDPLRGTFTGSAADLPAGAYRIWLASPQLTPPPPARAFNVVSPQTELTNLQMNLADLQLAAKRSRGRFYSIHTADRLVSDLPRGRRVPIQALPAIAVWNSSVLAALFVALITAEWLLRKRFGMV